MASNDHPDTQALAQARAQLEREIAERKAVEARYEAQMAQLRAERERLRELAEMSSEWFWEMDAELRFTKIYGGGLLASSTPTDPESPLGKRRWELATSEISPEQWAAHRQTLEARQPFRDFVYQIYSPLTNQWRWCSISGKPIFENGVFKGYHGMGIDITERKEVEKRVEYLAYHDALTGLPNRALLQDRMQQMLAQAERASEGLALAFIDLDNFKRINDSLGHAAGDALLKEIATRLKSCVRESDTVSRQSGDEFILVLGGVDSVQRCIPTLDKIMRRLQEPMYFEGKEISASASIGVAFYPQDGKNYDELRKKADLAMYRSKDTGRNAYYFYDEAMNDDAEEHLLLRNGLRLAIERGEFVLHYQPQMDIRSGRLVGVEALLRWQSPALGLVEPGRFIHVAEDSGLIVPIGAWALEQACRQARAWQDAGLPPLTVAVNLSAVQFRRDDVETIVDQALERSGLPPHCLELELTESILLQDVDQVQALVRRLRQRGMHFSIDDFGTGYSSLAYLKRMDIDKLKIDRSFVHDLGQTADAAAIVEAIVEMAHKLGLRTVAEGVESPELLQRLREIGCDEAQGYLHARPMAAPEFARYLHAHFESQAQLQAA
jgi:diguanylate cyclase (GGDEF)-like protein